MSTKKKGGMSANEVHCKLSEVLRRITGDGDEISAKEAQEANNAAGKMISLGKLQLEAMRLGLSIPKGPILLLSSPE